VTELLKKAIACFGRWTCSCADEPQTLVKTQPRAPNADDQGA